MNTRLIRAVAAALLVSGIAVSGFAAEASQPAWGAAATCTIGATLREGSRGADVVCLETQLIARGLTGVIGPDDYFGPSTTQAVITFQIVHGLAADGIVGPRTRASLATVSAGSVAPGPPVPAHVLETRTIGTSVQGRPITAVRMGTPGGRVVMIVGIIHGDETKGALVTAALRTMATPAGIDLWLIDSMNPDGVAANTRGNANGVDLNRNFDVGWNYIPRSTTNHQYSGEFPEEQPESQAIASFVTAIQPAVAIFYHQDANVVSVNGARR
ncbi:MAG: peptidase family protein, partial [Ilumatobacteraceae bacterium]|nr:peptidase family protein [Ilumatobacteraceae bacterium]